MSLNIRRIPKNSKNEYQTLTVFPAMIRDGGNIESDLILLPNGTNGVFISCKLIGEQGEGFDINLGWKRFVDTDAGLEQGNLINLNDPGVTHSIVYLDTSQLGKYITLLLSTNTTTNCKVDLFPIVNG